MKRKLEPLFSRKIGFQQKFTVYTHLVPEVNVAKVPGNQALQPGLVPGDGGGVEHAELRGPGDSKYKKVKIV